MKALVLTRLIFFSWCLCELLYTNDANHPDHLHKLMKESRRSPSFPQVNSWANLDNEKVYEPVYISSKDGSMEDDKIVELPGQPQIVNFNQYAGYVTVEENKGRALFYYFVESPHEPLTKPLVLWLTGGPGCSSLGGGAMLELGPFRVNSDGETLHANPYAWNKVANVIFLESPAGVGFSYSNTTLDYGLMGDKLTARDTYTFLVKWLARFPQYKNRDFYISGESYAGHYVPELAGTIISNNKITNQTINLKGISVGNALIDRNTNKKAYYDYLWTHALISDETYSSINSACNFSSENYTTECMASQNAAYAESGNIDAYDIYGPLCHVSSNKNITVEPNPCAWDYPTTYLNLLEVQKALHANVTKLSYPWSLCSAFIHGTISWHDSSSSTLPIIKKLIESGVRIWLYSGDTDAVVPVTSTRYTLKLLGLPIKTSWRPWYTDNEVGGYVVGYEGLVFVTVRGAGHQVPFFKPKSALIVFTSFLGGTLPPVA